MWLQSIPLVPYSESWKEHLYPAVQYLFLDLSSPMLKPVFKHLVNCQRPIRSTTIKNLQMRMAVVDKYKRQE